MMIVLLLLMIATTIRASEVNIGVLVKECEPTLSDLKRSVVHEAEWICDRLNNLQYTGEVDVDVLVHRVCTIEDYYDAIFELYRNGSERYLLGIVADEPLPDKAVGLMQVFGINYQTTVRFSSQHLHASIKIAKALNWGNDVSIIVQDQNVLKEFYRSTRKEWMCVKRFRIIDDIGTSVLYFDSPLIIIAESWEIGKVLQQISFNDDVQLLLVPLDGKHVNDAPNGSYIIKPLQADVAHPSQKILPSPLLFEVANPLLSLTANLSQFIRHSCNATNYKLNCIRNLYDGQSSDLAGLGVISTPEQVLHTLKIDTLSDEFVYEIFRIDANNINGTFNLSKVFTYGVISNNLSGTLDAPNVANSSRMECLKNFEDCMLDCENFKSFELTRLFPSGRYFATVSFRLEPWVFAFLAVSLLGVIISISIMVFIISRFCKRSVLEGNPILTILLLLTVMLMYLGIIPFAIEANQHKYIIYLSRALSVTLPYAFAFALLLARAILLATVSKEIGFMSHVSGTVQAFLTLFIFAVQCALSLQLNANCENIFRRNLLVYLLAYNVVLLFLLMFITPMISKTQRNYKEGRYFTISVCLMVCAWSGWLPAYAVFDEEWRDPLLCLGLVTTASILLGTIFVPRTYLMTVSAAKERFTSALPSLATATSAIDIYRASTQPVYDCVNVAAINNTLQNDLPQPPPDFYSAPPMPDDDDFEVTNCNTPPPPHDKVTRF